MAGGPGIPLEDERFCVGPDTRLPLWYGRRSQLDVDRGPCMALSGLFYCSIEPTDNYRRKGRSSAHKSSPQGTGLSRAVRSAAVTVPAHEEGRLPVPGAVAVGPHREPAPVSPHRVVTRPQRPSPQSIPHPPSRPPAEQYRRFEVARL